MSQPDYDQNLTTDIPPAIKAKITEYRIACEEYAFVGAKAPEERQQVIDDLCIRRHNSADNFDKLRTAFTPDEIATGVLQT